MSNQVEVLIENVKRKSTIWKWGLGIGTVILAGPLLWMFFYALLGAAAVGAVTLITGAVVLAAVNYYPVFTMKLENRKIQAIKDEAAANPIPTMQSIYNANEAELERSKRAIEEFATEVNVFRSKAQSHAKKYPEDTDAITTMAQEATDYETLLKFREQKWGEARADQKMFDRTIQMMSSRFDAATAGVKANKLSAIGKKDLYAKIKLEASYDSVMRRNAQAFAGMRSALMEATPVAPALTHQPADVIEMQPVNQKEGVLLSSEQRAEHQRNINRNSQ